MNSRSVVGKAVVVGAGVMGAQIAAHLSNAQWSAVLLDIVPSDGGQLPADSEARNGMAKRGLDRAQKLKPVPFFLPQNVQRITLGNIEDDLTAIKDADWVIEAVVEKPDVKRRTHEAIEAHLGPESVVTTNTSGLSIDEMSEGRSDAFRSRFFGTHFFNPPRYMKLLEIIPTPHTSLDVLSRFNGFAESILGKRIVTARDTPGFIANRLGVYGMQSAVHATLKHGLSVEQVDYLTGPLIGHPRSGTYRLSDICGLDISADVAGNLSERLPKDRFSAAFALPAPMEQLLKEGRIGEKAGLGFFKRLPDKTILALDWETMDYRPRKPVLFPAIEGVKSLPRPERLRALLELDDPAGRFLWETTRDMLCYSAEIANEIAEDIPSIDNAIKWGFGWEMGPFEIWDVLGVSAVTERLRAEGTPIPALVDELLHAGHSSFYFQESGRTFATDLATPSIRRAIPETPQFIVIRDLKANNKIVKDTPDATLVDLGDGVNCLEFHTKMNVLGPGIIEMMNWSRRESEKNGVALVIGNQGEHFSAGFNIQLILLSIYEGDWDQMLANGSTLQDAVMGIKRSRVPVVAAVHGYTLGGGCETMLHCAAVQASAESYIGLPETGIGAIPGGAGTKEMLLRAMAGVPDSSVEPFPFVHKVFETIGMAKMSTSADEARVNGFLGESDNITMNPDRVLHDAKLRALSLAATQYHPKEPAQVMVMGQDGIARFDLELHVMRRGGFISEHDQLIGHELATILCGGNLVHPQTVSEEYLLQLEREAFVRLCSTPKTAERIKYMLETGKPLRN